MEGRRGARVATTFLVAIVGLETTPLPRQGDISATGVYFETDVDVGGAGTIHWLHLVSVDGASELRVMAYVVRTAVMSNVEGHRISGAAFEFMPESDDAITALQEFVRYALALRFTGVDPHIAPRLDATASAGKLGAAGPGASKGASSKTAGAQASGAALVRKLSVQSMVLETSWAIAPGESVRVDIVAPGMTRRIRLEGRATRVAPRRGPNASTYMIELEVQKESDRPIRHHSSMSFGRVRPEELAAGAGVKGDGSPQVSEPEGDDGVTRMLDDLLSALVLPAAEDDGRRSRVHHLSGQLSRIPLTTLCSLFEMERLTGELVVRHDIEEVRLFVENGQFVDLDPLIAAETGRQRLRTILAWQEGAFEFYVQPVSRPNRINASMTALLLDLAREADEEGRDGGE